MSSLTLMSRFTSCLSNLPFPSLSYILKDHLSLASRSPLRIRWSAATYSMKSSLLSCKQTMQSFNYKEAKKKKKKSNSLTRICCVFYPICVEGVEDRLDVERLLCWAALHTEDPLELVEVQGAARTLLHEHDAQLLNLSQIHLLTVALFLAHVRLIPVRKGFLVKLFAGVKVCVPAVCRSPRYLLTRSNPTGELSSTEQSLCAD